MVKFRYKQRCAYAFFYSVSRAIDGKFIYFSGWGIATIKRQEDL